MSSVVTNLRRQFVQRRLWPVAILLIAALAAVPLVLAKDPAPAPPAPPVPTAETDGHDELAAQPIVAPAAARSKRRKVLGSAKNPFGVAEAPAAASSSDDSTIVTRSQDSGDSSDTGADAPSSGGTTPASTTPTTTSPTTPAPTTPAEPAPKPKSYAPQELTVRFGEEDAQRQSLKRLQALPSEDEPMLIYMGLLRDGKTAEFMVGDGVAPVGDGECRPSPEECQVVRLRAGETEFFDVQDETGAVTGQFQLDLLKIHRSGGASASRAKASVKAAVSLAQSGAALRSTVGRSIARLP
jgi:hypothetical protein